ncbi:Ig-like domain-containing protein [Flexithrix dorotheae]|uniref:Ig-like domain-containing protein n=1 Tax=Flexithrix dorotheae TaxID=70993 RepID=UPI00146D3B68|nr:Ig-like domain-containing protein [Flexithrix dorotheae]
MCSLISLAFILQKCASVQSPPGGPRDQDPPELLNTVPLNSSLNYKGKVIQFEYNEPIQLDNIFKQLLVTPYSDNKFSSKVKKNRVIIEFEEPFEENTTYTINLRDAVVDATEKNIATNSKVAFSTGDFIDSLSISGNIRELMTGNPVEDGAVMLFRLEDTLNVQDPYYLTKTDEFGFYELENIKVGEYVIYALSEEDNNYSYTKPEEKIGFLAENIVLDSNITELNIKVAEYDNIDLEFKRANSKAQYVEIEYSKPLKDYKLQFLDGETDSIYHGIDNNLIRLYQYTAPEIESITSNSKPSRQPKEKKKKGKKNNNDTQPTETITNTVVEDDSISLIVTAIDLLENEVTDTMKIKFANRRKSDPQPFSISISPANGTKMKKDEYVNIEIKLNKPPIKSKIDQIALLELRDTTLFELDSSYLLVEADTIQFPLDSTYLIPKKIDVEQEYIGITQGIIDSIEIRFNDSYVIDNQYFKYKTKLFDSPKSINYIKGIKYLELINDTSSYEILTYDTTNYNIDTVYYDAQVTDTLPLPNHISSNHNNTFFTIDSFIVNSRQSIFIDSTVFISVENDTLDKIVINYKVKKEEDYGVLGGNVITDKESFFIQILSKDYQLEQELYNARNFKFEFVEPGEKILRILVDNNNNGIWEKGSFKERIPHEDVYFREEGTINIKPNWEILDETIDTEEQLPTYSQENLEE